MNNNTWINYHHLFYFKTIAEEGSVSKAAEKLRLGQPTLSSQLSQFEDNLGVLLFDRIHKKLVLTEQGKVAFDYAKNIFNLGSEMLEVIHDRLRPLKTTLHIGALDSIPKQLVLEIVKFAMKISPCQITLSEGRLDELTRELVSYRMDIIITNYLGTGLDARGLNSKSISKKNVAFYGCSKFKSLKDDFPRSISGQPLIFPTYDSRLRRDLEHWAKLQKIELNIIIESQDISVKKLMAISKMGIIATSAPTVTNQVLRGELIEIGKLQGVHEELFLVTANRKIENTIASKIMSDFEI